jgi:hypothetical protein
VADTAEQIAYDQELAKIEVMPAGEAKSEATIKFNQKYPNGRPGLTSEQIDTKCSNCWQSLRLYESLFG